MTRRERREAEERAREEALRAAGSSGDTVVVGGITFRGPAPISPALGTPVAPAPASRRTIAPQAPASAAPAPHAYVPPPATPSSSARPTATPQRRASPSAPSDAVPAPESGSPSHRDLPSRAERASREPRTSAEAPRGWAWLPRVAVLGALAAATIAAPLAPLGSTAGSGGASPFDLDVPPSGPSTLDVVSARAAVPAMAAGIEAAPVVARDLSTASRSQERDPLPGCDASVATTSANGNLSDAELCDLPFAPGERLSTRAAVALTALNEAFRDEFGTDIALVDSYRSLEQQYSVKESRGYLAASPGTSMHGLGLAIDLAGSVTGNSAAYKWLVANGAAYGWENPPWARRGGAGNYEPWHFEFRPGVEEVSTWH